MKSERLRLYKSRETAPKTEGAVFQVGELVESREKQDTIWQDRFQCTIPILAGLNIKTLTGRYVPLSVTLPKWVENPQDNRFQKLQQLVDREAKDTPSGIPSPQQEKTPFQLQSTSESWASLLKVAFTNNAWIKNPALAKLIFESPTLLRRVLSQKEYPDINNDGLDLLHPETGETLQIPEGGGLTPERYSLIVCALLMDDTESGPEQLLRFFYHAKHEKANKKKRFSFNKTSARDNFFDDLILEVNNDSDAFTEAKPQSAESEAIKSDREYGIKFASDTSIIEHALALESAAKKGEHSQAVLDGLSKQKKILNQQKYLIPKEKPVLTTQEEVATGQKKASPEDTRRFQREEWSQLLVEQLSSERQKRQHIGQDPEPDNHLYALLQFQRGNYSHGQLTRLKQLAFNATQKNPSELTHEEAAVLLSMEMEIKTRPVSAKIRKNAFTSEEVRILQITAEIHEYGYFFVNSKLGKVHDPMALHMSGGVLCPVHTPIQMQMMSNAIAQVQAATEGLHLPISSIGNLSALSGFTEALGGMGALTSGLPLFAQAFVAVGSGLAEMASGSGASRVSQTSTFQKTSSERPASTTPKIISAKVRASQSSRPKPKLLVQSSSTTVRAERRSSLPVQTKPKQRRLQTPSPKKQDKPESVLAPQLAHSKSSQVQIVTARVESKPKISIPPIKERKLTPPTITIMRPRVERAPRLSLQPRITTNSGSERKVSRSLSDQRSQREDSINVQSSNRPSIKKVSTIRPPTFSKRVEQAFQAKSSSQAMVRSSQSSISLSRSETTAFSQQRTEQYTERNAAIKLQSKPQTQSKPEKISQVVSASVTQKTQTREAQARPVTTLSKKEVTSKHVSNEQTVMKKANKESKTPQKEVLPVQVTKSTAINTGENLVTLAAALVGEMLFESAKRATRPKAQDRALPVSSISESVGLPPTENTKTAVADVVIARKHTEYSQGRSGGSRTQKKQKTTTATKAANLKTDKVLTATMLRLPTSAMIDVSDSFNTAREVKMWAQEALAHPKLMERYYATAA